jgi:hypothetical protein
VRGRAKRTARQALAALIKLDIERIDCILERDVAPVDDRLTAA